MALFSFIRFKTSFSSEVRVEVSIFFVGVFFSIVLVWIIVFSSGLEKIRISAVIIIIATVVNDRYFILLND